MTELKHRHSNNVPWSPDPRKEGCYCYASRITYWRKGHSLCPVCLNHHNPQTKKQIVIEETFDDKSDTSGDRLRDLEK